MSPLKDRLTVRFNVFESSRTGKHARSNWQAAWSGERQRHPRDIPDDAVAAGRDDRRRADFALFAGAGAAGAGHHVRARYLDRANDRVALHGRHRLFANHHGTAVGSVRTPSGAARRSRPDGGASAGCIFAETLPQLIAARFLQALGGATGMVVSRAIIRDLYSRERISAMISLVIAVMMIAQMLSPLTGGLLETAFGWRSIFYVITAASLAIAVAIAWALPETRPGDGDGDRKRCGR